MELGAETLALKRSESPSKILTIPPQHSTPPSAPEKPSLLLPAFSFTPSQPNAFANHFNDPPA